MPFNYQLYSFISDPSSEKPIPSFLPDFEFGVYAMKQYDMFHKFSHFVSILPQNFLHQKPQIEICTTKVKRKILTVPVRICLTYTIFQFFTGKRF